MLFGNLLTDLSAGFIGRFASSIACWSLPMISLWESFASVSLVSSLASLAERVTSYGAGSFVACVCWGWGEDSFWDVVTGGPAATCA